MGYDISLVGEDGNVVSVETHYGGGYILVGGNDFADISITYNYSKYFYDTIDEHSGIRWLYGRTGEQCVPVLRGAINYLGDKQSVDYWKPTAGNAGYVLLILLKWAEDNPTAVFEGD